MQYALTHLAWGLLHSVWQIALTALCLWVALIIIPKAHSRLRYWLCLISLYLCPIIFTLTLLAIKASWTSVNLTGVNEYPVWIISVIWMMCACFVAYPKARQWQEANRLAQSPHIVPPITVQRMFEDMLVTVGLERHVTLGLTDKVPTPCTLGWLKPVILFPTSMLTQLTPDEIEAILAHELAHIRQADFIHEICQAVIEAVFFFHPAIYYITRQVRIERERACDQIAATYIASPKPLATALLKTGLMSSSNNFVLSISKQKGGKHSADELKYRAARLVEIEHYKNAHTRSWLQAILFGVIMLGSILFTTGRSEAVINEYRLTRLKDEVCAHLNETELYWHPDYMKAGEATITLRDDIVYMNRVALPEASQSYVQSVFSNHRITGHSSIKLQYYGPAVRLTLENQSADNQSEINIYNLDPDKQRVEHQRFVSQI